MNNPYDAPKAHVTDTSRQRFSTRNAVSAFLAASILVPASIFIGLGLVLDVPPDGSGNLGSWSLILFSALFGAAIAGRFSRLSMFAAAAVGVATAVFVSIIGTIALAAWLLVTGAV